MEAFQSTGRGELALAQSSNVECCEQPWIFSFDTHYKRERLCVFLLTVAHLSIALSYFVFQSLPAGVCVE